MTNAEKIIGLPALQALREAGFVVIHREPTEQMMKAGCSAAGRVYGSLMLAYHRMVAESIRQQNSRGEG